MRIKQIPRNTWMKEIKEKRIPLGGSHLSVLFNIYFEFTQREREKERIESKSNADYRSKYNSDVKYRRGNTFHFGVVHPEMTFVCLIHASLIECNDLPSRKYHDGNYP